MWKTCKFCGKKINVKKEIEPICKDCAKSLDESEPIKDRYICNVNCWIGDIRWEKEDITEDDMSEYVKIGLFRKE